MNKKLLLKKLCSNDGVTLIELIIAVAISAIVLTMVGSSLYASVRSEYFNAESRKNRESIVGSLDCSFETGATGTDVNVVVDFPASDDENIACTKITDTTTGYNIGIVKMK